jgi:hypothetical protein
MENNWSHSQTGAAVLLNTTNQGGKCLWCAVMDVTFTNNIIRHTSAVGSIQGNDYHFPNSTGRTKRLKIYNNLFDDVDNVKWKNLGNGNNGVGYFFLLASGANETGPDDVFPQSYSDSSR